MNKKGFTLVELILVIALIAIVGLITLPNIMDMLDSSKEEKYNNYFNLIEKSMELYRIDNKEALVWSNENKINITKEQLLKSSPDLNLGECDMETLEMKRTMNDSLGETTYSYSYYICITCPEKENLICNKQV